MIFIYNSKGGSYQPYSKIPKSVAKKYESFDLLLSILDSMASSNGSQYHFNSWESALKAAWKQGKNKGLIDHLCMHHHYRYPKNPHGVHHTNYTGKRDRVLSDFLGNQVGRHLWASDPRAHDKLKVSRSNVLTNSFFNKAKKVEITDHYKIMGTLNINQDKDVQDMQNEEVGVNKKQKKKNESLLTVYTPFMAYLSPKTSLDEQFNALMQLHGDDAVMNCEQFVAYSLCSVGLIKENELQTLFSACAYKKSLDPFYFALGFDDKTELDSALSFQQLQESHILIENKKDLDTTNGPRQVSHMLIYNNVDKHIYDLSFGNSEKEWRVKKTPIEEYLVDLDRRGKKVSAIALSGLNLQNGLSKAQEIINTHSIEEISPDDRQYVFI